MISFAAITPHPPLLIPAIGKEHADKLKVTRAAMEDLEKKLDKTGINTLIIISSHNKMHHDAFGILLNDKYVVSFKEFGDFETKLDFFPDLEITEKIRHAAINYEIPLTLIHEDELDYSFGVPLYYLAKNKNIKIIPFLHTFGDPKDQYEMGRLIKAVAAQSNKKIGVIVSGHLSHKSSEASPVGFSKKGEEFNKKLRELLETKNTAGILSMDKKFVADADESVLLPLSALLGVIDKINYKPQTFSFESPLGVGYLVFNFKIIE